MATTKRAKGPTLPRDDRPPRAVTRDLFLVWRAPRVGVCNPQRLTNPVWSWLALRRELNAYMANRHFEGPSSMTVGPCWCGNRFGQSHTALPDGRTLSIGGEHEDHYDPDFYIYNDVFLATPSGEVEIYGYPYEVFPPTDFHTATLVDDRVVILGCLGHPRQRRPGVTPSYALDLRTLAIAPLVTTGTNPGWIFRHSAELSDDRRSITVRGGERVESAEQIVENIDDWSLDLESLAWTRLTDRAWPLWELVRADGQRNHLMTMRWMSWHAAMRSDFDREQIATHTAEIGWMPDLALYAERFSPPMEHRTVQEDEDAPVGTSRITVDGVTVRYVEGFSEVRVTVEGALSPEVIRELVEDARRKLETLERTPYVARQIR